MARKRAEKPSWFKLFGDQEPLMQAMPDASVGAAVRGAMHYFNTGELPELTEPFAVALFAMLRPHVEESFEDFRRSVEAGKTAMEKRWGKKGEEGVRGLPPVIPGNIEAEAEAENTRSPSPNAGAEKRFSSSRVGTVFSSSERPMLASRWVRYPSLIWQAAP